MRPGNYTAGRCSNVLAQPTDALPSDRRTEAGKTAIETTPTTPTKNTAKQHEQHPANGRAGWTLATLR